MWRRNGEQRACALIYRASAACLGLANGSGEVFSIVLSDCGDMLYRSIYFCARAFCLRAPRRRRSESFFALLAFSGGASLPFTTFILLSLRSPRSGLRSPSSGDVITTRNSSGVVEVEVVVLCLLEVSGTKREWRDKPCFVGGEREPDKREAEAQHSFDGVEDV